MINTMMKRVVSKKRNTMVENSGIEPLTSCVQSRRSPSWANSPKVVKEMVGLGGVEPPTSPLSGVRSNHLSYKPFKVNKDEIIN